MFKFLWWHWGEGSALEKSCQNIWRGELDRRDEKEEAQDQFGSSIIPVEDLCVLSVQTKCEMSIF